MTLVDIKNSLLSHFLNSSTFNLETDLASVKVNRKEDGDEFVDSKIDVVRYALDDMVKLGLVAKVKESLYVLSGPLNQINQTVVIGPMTAMMVADMVNGWTNDTGEMKETGYAVNKLSVTDRDIAALCHICHVMLSNDMDDDESEEELKQP